MNTALERWAAAQRIYQACPFAADDLDICLRLNSGAVRARAEVKKWKLSTNSVKAELESSDDIAQTFGSLISIIRQEIAEFERHQKSTGASDGRIRSLATLVKTLQGLEEMQKRMEKAADDKIVDSEDLLEIHGRLAGKIEKIIQREKNC